MTPTPVVSIIVPVYNAEKFLNRCIDSILAQTYTDWELLLIDDGSKDASGRICDEYATKDERIRVFHKENGGVSSARNLGLDHAQGEWITFVDSDDYIEENFLKSFEGNLDADLVVGNAVLINNENRMSIIDVGLSEGLYPFPSKSISSILSKSIIRVPWGKLYKKECIGSLRFDIKMKIGEDNHFVFCFLHKIKEMRILVSSPPTGNRYVYIEPLVSCDEKYQISVESSVYHLLKIEEAYLDLGLRDQSFEIFNAQAFYERCVNDMPFHGELWYKNKEIERICLRRSAYFGILPWIRTWLSFHFFYRLKMHQAKKVSINGEKSYGFCNCPNI